MFSKIFKLGKSKKYKQFEKSESISSMVCRRLQINESIDNDKIQTQFLPKYKSQEVIEDNRHGNILFVQEKQVQIQERISSGSSDRREQKSQQSQNQSQSSQSSLDDQRDIGQKLNILFTLLQGILLRENETKNQNSQFLEYNYQQIYEQVYSIVNTQKTQQIEKFQEQRRFDNFVDLILYHLFYVLVQKKVLPKIQKQITYTFSNILQPISYQIKNQKQQNQVNNQKKTWNCLNQLNQIIKKIRTNIQEVGSILLYIETEINEQNRFLRFNKQDHKYDQNNNQQLQRSKHEWEWKYSCYFSISETIYDMVIKRILKNQVKLIQQKRLNDQQQDQEINNVNMTFQKAFIELNKLFIISKQNQRDQKLKQKINKSIRQLKDKLVQFTQLLIKSTYGSYHQKSFNFNNLHNIFYSLILNNSLKSNLIHLYSNFFNSSLTYLNASNLKLNQFPQIQQEQKIINHQIFNFLQKAKQILNFIKSILRSLFLQPQLHNYRLIQYKNNQTDFLYLKQRNQTKKYINHFISSIFALSIFSKQNIVFILQHAVSLNIFHRTKSQEILISSKRLDQKILNKLIAFFIGQKEQNEQKISFFQNFHTVHKQLQVQKTINQQQLILSFQPYIQSSHTFFQKYNQIIFNQQVKYYRERFNDKLSIGDLQSMQTSNKLINDFLNVYRKFKNLINNEVNEKDAISWIINVNQIKLASLLYNLSKILENPNTNIEMRLIIYANGLQNLKLEHKIAGNNQRQEYKQEIIMSFLQMFKLGCKNQQFRDRFELLLCRMLLYQALTQINCQFSNYLNSFIVDKQILQQNKLLLQQKSKVYNWQYVNILPQKILSQLLITQGTQYLNRVMEIRKSIKIIKILYNHPFNKSTSNSKIITKNTSDNTQKVKVYNINTNYSKVFSHSKLNKDLSIMNVILLNQKLFLSKYLLNPFIHQNYQQIILYRTPIRNQQDNQTKYSTQLNFNSPNIVYFKKIDPILSKFIKEYQQKFYLLQTNQNQTKKHKQLYWILSSFLESNVILNLKIPIKNHHLHQRTQNNTIHNQMDSTISHDNQAKQISFRMPFIMADIFLFSLRKRIHETKNYTFTVQQYLVNAFQLYEQERQISHQFFRISQKLVKLTRKMIQSGLLQISDPKEQQIYNQKTEIKINQMLYKWRTKKQNDFLRKIIENNQSQIDYLEYENKTGKINLIDFMQKLNKKFQPIDLNQRQSEVTKGQDEIQKQFQHPSTQFLFLFECILVKFFKRMKKVDLNQMQVQLFMFIIEHFENKKKQNLNLVENTLIYYSKIFLENQKLTTDLQKLEFNRQKARYILFKQLTKLIKKQYILMKYKEQNQQIPSIQSSIDLNYILKRNHIYFQYNP